LPEGIREAHRVTGTERLVGLTDDVFAFAITLLVLELVTPVVTGPATNSSLAAAIGREYPSLIDFAVSFWVAGLLWMSHHRVFQYIKASDPGLLTLNMVFLFFVVLIPFATRVLDSYESVQLATLVFVLPLLGASLMNGLVWRYASNHHLVDEYTPRGAKRWFTVQGPITSALFAASVSLSFIEPDLTVASWFAIVPAIHFLGRRYSKQD